MSLLLWLVAAATALFVLWHAVSWAGRIPRTRARVLDEVRRVLRGGVVEKVPGRGVHARGRLGELEVSVDCHVERRGRSRVRVWRVVAVGPVNVDQALEARIAGWGSWIDPWMQTAPAMNLPAGVGPSIQVHAERSIPLDHPVVVALRRQGPSLGPGTLHVRNDFMRAEVGFAGVVEDNKPLFAFLQAMAEIAGRQHSRVRWGGARPGITVEQAG